MNSSLTDQKVIRANFQLNFAHSATAQQKDAPFDLDVDVTLPGSGITAIFGHSGSGKTTLLRCIAGLEQPSQGLLTVNGDLWQNGQTFLPTHKRPLAYVFQESSLFPHLTAKGNLNYAIKRSKQPLSQDFYDRVINTMGIESILSRYPAQLSGGERQRVAIARALLIQPQLLLMDEPLASLDLARKQEILPYLERLKTHFDLPILYVSHSMDEVARLADHAVTLNEGRVIAQGNLTEVFSRIDLPISYGDDTGVVIKGRIVERDEQWQLNKVEFDGGAVWVCDGGEAIDQQVRIRVLAKDVSLALSSHDDMSILNRIQVCIEEIHPCNGSSMSLVRLKAGDSFLIARLTNKSLHHLNLTQGSSAWAQIKSVAIVH
ncbi:molybdenum ABC transporter ATP-binding protein [Litoribrevibacter albus]|uniref:Molybdenum import ATP-binding protein ModC n=1 Tax=Litoribrevibacter albus TaxID=1473156 RepID=A0AA37S8K5_9GAMM|nr:molybdenum ABC transporter ATP-binding protein [Litoribrevibacter albus]GLQ30443.1 molybdenum import ATP-binding protein ModC [Litoribrevibacter albus]